ncbi:MULTISPECIES: (2,3-dihydroxybenzoyl)adenylate synthase [Actinoalloteichus]|uniref:Peptide arylation enzyme n=1 Tax=Actinoalloteichus fjordicus TaxID=1612552 RepID=A0AAC9PT01_9PSEU|nr:MULTISPECIES: AMP-binding protein [Actinoalloteichus]APU15532.1 peptide arylation enzyme [Actinoalloteichus fjordicus]APU21599.1 peptide arylation enzyme [Actinoalloteichus sp. GBA129-24]
MNTEALVPWPADLAHAYRVAGCWRGRSLGSGPWEWAEQWGDRVAVVGGDRRLTFRELAMLTDRLAEGFGAVGLVRGDTVLVQLPNGWEFVVTTLACLRAGVVPVMMLPPHREYELASIGRHVDAKALIVPDDWRGYDHQELALRVAATLPSPAKVIVAGENVRSECLGLRELMSRSGQVDARRRRLDAVSPDASDVAVFLLSGGTTGVPKVIGRTHDDYDYNIRRSAAVCGFGPDTVYLAVLPAGHNFPLASPGILGALSAGGRVVMLPSPRSETVFATIAAERVTVTSAVPAIVLRWMEEVSVTGPDLSSLRIVHVGGSVLSPEVAARIGPALGCRVQQVYGMAEGLLCYTPIDAPDEVTHRTQGAPISPYDELLVVDRDGRAVPRGRIGELLTRGPYTPRGYFGVPEQNALSYTEDGWYRTGDLVRITPEGNIVVCGRVKDLINRAGEKISAGEIETLVQEMPAIIEAAAVAMPDPQVGERVCLFVRARPGRTLTLDDVAEALTARGVAAFKIPERLELLDDLPHTPVGKPDKAALRGLLAAKPDTRS